MMKRWVMVLAVLFLLGYAVGAFAAPDYVMVWWRAPAGGGMSGASGYRLSGAVGQAEAGTLRGDGYALTGGFWGAPYGPYTLFLPIVIRS